MAGVLEGLKKRQRRFGRDHPDAVGRLETPFGTILEPPMFPAKPSEIKNSGTAGANASVIHTRCEAHKAMSAAFDLRYPAERRRHLPH